MTTPIIFIGHLDRVETTRHPGRKWGFKDYSTAAYDSHKVWIRVDESFKGAKAGDTFMYAEDEGNCSRVFQDRDTQGQWLFYVWPAPSSQMVHMGCSRTTRLPNAAADLLFLRALPNSERKNRLSGTVSRLQDLDEEMFDRTQNVSGVRITVLSESTTREMRTDGNGVFEFTELVPGNYRVQLEAPNSDLVYMAYSIGGSAQRVSNGQFRERTQSVLVGAEDGVEVNFILISQSIAKPPKSRR